MSLLNGLNAMGSAVANFAGAAGLEAQKHEADMQMAELSNSLMAQREHVGRVESGQIAAEQQGRAQDFSHTERLGQQGFEASQEDKRIAAQKNITGMQLDASRYQWSPGTQIDASGKEVTGMWKLPTRGDEAPVFVPGSTMTPKYSQITPNEALNNARRDYKTWADKDKAAGGDGTVYNLDGSVADPERWITSQAEKYRTGKLSNLPSNGAAPAVAPPPPQIPAPLTGKPGLQWSPSQKQFRDATGKLYDQNGKPLN